MWFKKKKPKKDHLLSFEYKGNRIKCNVEKEELTRTISDPNWHGSVEVTYNDGGSKRFDRFNWQIFGDDILLKKPNIKVIVR